MTKTVSATLRYLRMSPRKVRLLVDLIRGQEVAEAETQLTFSTKIGAKPLLKLLRSAKANAVHNAALDPDTLKIDSAFVDGGPMQYRFTPRAFGRATPIRHRTAHITLVLRGDVNEKAASKVVKKEKDTEEKTETHDHAHDHVHKGEKSAKVARREVARAPESKKKRTRTKV